MSWLHTTLLLTVGLLALAAGGELLVRGASRLATAMGISRLVIGLTVVAFGTSAPELAVSVQSVFTGRGGLDIALGNVVGSNIFNVLFILGISAAIVPLVVDRHLVRRDVPVMIAVSVVSMLFALDGNVGRFDGAVLLLCAFAYTTYAVLQTRWEQRAEKAKEAEEGETIEGQKRVRLVVIDLLLIGAGLALLVFGSRWLVTGAITVARFLGVTELVIGLTIVAAGTSLPEVAASIVAAIRGERDIAVGNVVGSNIFNIVFVLGLSSLIATDGIPVSQAVLTFDVPIMVGVAVACLPIFFTGYNIARWEGVVLLGGYGAYTTFVVLSATRSPALESFANVVIVVLPLIVATIIWTTVQAMRRRHEDESGP